MLVILTDAWDTWDSWDMAEDQDTGCPIFIERHIADEMKNKQKALPLQYSGRSKQAAIIPML